MGCNDGESLIIRVLFVRLDRLIITQEGDEGAAGLCRGDVELKQL